MNELINSICLIGLGLAYAGSNREDVLSLLLPVLSNAKSSMEAIGVAAMACGLVAVGSCNSDVTSALLQTLMEKSEVELKDTFARFLPLGLGLTYLGKQEAAETVVLALEVLTDPFKVMNTSFRISIHTFQYLFPFQYFQISSIVGCFINKCSSSEVNTE